MTRTASQLLLLGLIGLLSLGAEAGTYRMDDSLSRASPPSAQMQWRPVSRREPSAGMETWVRVDIHVATREWAGQTARVYMVMEADAGNAVEATWTTGGRLLPGRLTPGDRSLVYAGPIPADSLQDQLQLRLRSGADWTTQQRRLNFHFEIETDR